MTPGRIIGLDVARAFAVVGMVIVNFKTVMAAVEGPQWLHWAAGSLEGRAAATFVVLAGVGMSLMARRALATNDAETLGKIRKTLLRRALFLFLFGLAFVPIWPADILRFYGLYMALGVALLAAPTPKLWAVIVGLPILFFALLAVFDYEAGWDFSTLTYHGFWTPDGFMRHMLFNGFHPLIPWGAFLVLGLWLGRQDLLNPATRRRLFVASVAIAAAAHAGSYVLVSAVGGELAEVLTTEMIPPGPIYILAGGSVAIAFITLCAGLADHFTETAPIAWLVRTGQLAMTLYVSHVVFGLGALSALGRLEGQTLTFSVAAALIFCAVAVVLSNLWRRRYERGPMEALMRRAANLGA